MKKRKKPNQTLLWLPRILAILCAVFISIFALDVFSEGYSIAETFIALFMHLIPTFLIIIALLIALKYKWQGGIIFIILGIITIFFFHTYRDIIVFLLISLPVLIIGILFLTPFIIKKFKK